MPHPYLYSCVCGADCGLSRGSLASSLFFPFLPVRACLCSVGIVCLCEGVGPREFRGWAKVRVTCEAHSGGARGQPLQRQHTRPRKPLEGSPDLELTGALAVLLDAFFAQFGATGGDDPC